MGALEGLLTSTSAAAGAPLLPVVSADPMALAKFGGGTVMGLAGMLYLGYGKKHGDVRKMLIGAALTFGSVLFF